MRLDSENNRIVIVLSALFLIGIYLETLTPLHFARPVFIGLSLYWTESLRRRIILKDLRRLLMSISTLLMLLFIFQEAKYSLFWKQPLLLRGSEYLYQVPLLCVPLFCFYASLCLERDRGLAEMKRPRWLLVPLSLLLTLSLSNELHQLLYRVTDQGSTGDTGPLYYINLFWQVSLLMASFIAALRRCRLAGGKRRYLPLVFLTSGFAFFMAYFAGGGHPLELPGVFRVQFQEAYAFMIIGYLEACIQAGFIQSNSNYSRLFSLGTQSAFITDDSFLVRYESAALREGAAEDAVRLKAATLEPQLLDADTRLSGKAIHGGYVFSIEDISSVNELNEELRDTAEQLREEAVLLKRENALKEEKSRVAAENLVYDEISSELLPALDGIEKLLDVRASGASGRELSKLAVLGAYIKRRANLFIMARQSQELDIAELLHAVRESVEYLRLSGIKGGVFLGSGAGALMPSEQVLCAYELFETIVESSFDVLKAIMVRISAEDGLLLSFELYAEGGPEDFCSLLSGSADAQLSMESDTDGTVFLTARFGKGAGI